MTEIEVLWLGLGFEIVLVSLMKYTDRTQNVALGGYSVLLPIN